MKMSEKNLNARIIHKHDTEANWQKATSFIPKQGELIVYDIDSTYSYERFKIGDKINGVISLLDAENNRIRVSVRRLEKQKEKANLKNFNDNASDKMTLGDIIKDQIS